jgi:thymidine phosphorylase
MAPHLLKARRLGVDTQSEAVVFMRRDCPVCRSEGFSAHSRVLLKAHGRQIIATLYQVMGELIDVQDVALSESAWERLGVEEGDVLDVAHPDPLDSLGLVRSRIYGHDLSENALHQVMRDVTDGKYSDIHLSAFVTACAARPLTRKEELSLTRAMVDVGERLSWEAPVVADKHSIGGLPGNRTTPIVVSIVAALGLTIPKTSSRAITSPAGTADMMETLAPVNLDLKDMRRVVGQEGGCIVWGGAIRLSPADDILIRIERALDIDTEGQMIASVLSKKIAAGATHLVIDMPVGSTAKVRDGVAAERLGQGLIAASEAFGLKMIIVPGDGRQPIGRGLGPGLEARDVLAVLQCKPDAPQELRSRALVLSGALLELSGAAGPGQGVASARQVLDDGRAWSKFQRICQAQGGMREPPVAAHRQPILARRGGQLAEIDNRKLAKLAKLAGAPEDKAAGLELHVRCGQPIRAGEPLCTVHAESPGELAYALGYAGLNHDIFVLHDA